MKKRNLFSSVMFAFLFLFITTISFDTVVPALNDGVVYENDIGIEKAFLTSSVVNIKHEPIFTASIGNQFIAAIQTNTVVEEVQLLDRLKDAFANPLGLSALILLITAYIKKKANSNGTITIIISILVGLVLSLAGWYFQWGMYTGTSWLYIFLYGVTAVLIANGLSTWELIKKLLELFKLKVPG